VSRLFWCGIFLLLAAGGGTAQERVSVREEPGTPIVAAEVWVAAGSADEPPEGAGLAYLTARAAVRPIRARLDSLGASLVVGSRKDAVTFSLTAAPQVWGTATGALLDALLGTPVDAVAVAEERAAIRSELAGRASNPADALARAVDRAVYGAAGSLGRSSVGTPEEIGALTPAQADRFLRDNFVPERMVVAVVGPVDRADVTARFPGLLPHSEWKQPPLHGVAAADTTLRVDYNSITSWVAASYPFGDDADIPALRLLADLAAERLGFGPARRSVYDVGAGVVLHPWGGELRVELVVPPGESSLWTERIREAVAAYADEPLPRARFEAELRRHRGLRLLQLSAPEDRAARDAESLLLRGSTTETPAELDALTPARLAAAAAALPPPTVVVLGPFANTSD
jgi:zinc protease